MTQLINQTNPSNDFEQQLEAQHTNLLKLAVSLTHDASRAEDLLQDTMLLALKFRANYQDGTNIRAWLSRIMKNRYISIVRRLRLEEKTMEEEGRYALRNWSLGEMGLRTTHRDGNVYTDEGFGDTVAAAISELKPEYRQVVILCDVDGMSYAEAAGELTCPVGTIMSRLHRGRRALRTRLVSRRQLEAAA
ncbi:MAG: sigma-70 family RNA polymerase sigma factor [Deltaproteobacteria bacterium]|nr:sigma-70 family RNA polymerase sigma factor [Deltaproteobacteria bacterium]MBN2674116.1 sigma-70 family RNA polymerase sigma factor [Deltaproteobacteria bacterium]